MKLLLWAAGIILLAWLGWGAICFRALGKAQRDAVAAEGAALSEKHLAQLGQAGDMFGSLSALVASMGFVGVAFTVYRQHMDGKDAAGKHAEVIAAEERVAKISFLRTAVDHAIESIRSIILREERINELESLIRIVSMRAVGTNRLLSADDPRAKEMARRIYELSLQFFEIGWDTSIAEVDRRFDSFATGERRRLRERRVAYASRLRSAMFELEAITKMNLPKMPSRAGERGEGKVFSPDITIEG